MRKLKRTLALVMALAMTGSMLAACGDDSSSTVDNSGVSNNSGTNDSQGGSTTTEQGKVLNIYAWNEEFKGFFEKYYAGTAPVSDNKTPDDPSDDIYFENAPGIPEGITVNWIINPSDDGVYQEKLDAALLGQADAAADDKIDMFLAEADYIAKYVSTDYTLDVSTIGVQQLDTMYDYTIQAVTDSRNDQVKGVSFQCCPSALIYRRSIAEDVLGTSDPAEVQELLNSWEKFDAVAATAKDKGYYMTASYVETYRIFSNNMSAPWVDADKNINFDDSVKTWAAQADKYLDNGYTLPSGVWGDEKNAQMFAEGKTMCFFGPAWYFNFCMGNAMDPEKGCSGDWAIVEGPQAHFWGGTWLLAATGTDNGDLVADIMTAFTANEEICSALIKNDAQFTNNMTVNQTFAEDPEYGNAFLGGQNDVAVFVELAKNIKFENTTQYDQIINEKYPEYMLDYFLGNVDEATALQNFYDYVTDKYPAIVTP